MRFLATICLFLAASAYGTPTSRESKAADAVLAPLMLSDTAVHIKDKYIVIFKDHVTKDDIVKHQSWLTSFVSSAKDSGYGPQSIFDFNGSSFRGYVGKFTEDQLAHIRSSGDVAYVEKDQIVYINDVEVPAPWGLSRLTSRTGVPSDRHYEYEADAGDGVTAYIVDTGINIEHVDFEGRAVWGKTIPDGDPDRDDNGHGTHVAGTVGGKKYGVAKKVKLVAVKVLRSSGSGTLSDVVKGIEYVLNQHIAASKKGKARSVANMSLGGGKSPSLDRAVDVAVEGGVHFAVAAGNDNQDACNYSPAASVKAITVGATNIDDEKAYFSNYGRCVNILAPGQDIESTWIGSKTATNTISGTSMASPHVCGAVAALLSRPEWADLSPADLRSQLVYVAGRYYIKGLPRGTRTPNRMLFIPPVKKE
ncbi:peptidase S8/S53 domain-containing protein [Cladochytrium replicatum]|nr:peptidase S8/S53 domain-containing protein [Cladochytrium replicatum]